MIAPFGRRIKSVHQKGFTKKGTDVIEAEATYQKNKYRWQRFRKANCCTVELQPASQYVRDHPGEGHRWLRLGGGAEHPRAGVVRRFAAHLRELRLARGMTQFELAVRASITTSSVG